MASTLYSFYPKLVTTFNPALPEQCKGNKTDREYQIRKRKPHGIKLPSEKEFLQKLEYLHNNPVSAGAYVYAEEYHFPLLRFMKTELII